MKAINTGLFILFSVCVVIADPTPRLKFIENKNQWESSVYFRSTIPSGFMSLTHSGFSFHFYDYSKIDNQHPHQGPDKNESGEMGFSNQTIDALYVRATFVGANDVKPTGYKPSIEYYNYFRGTDESKWASRAYAYEEVTFENKYQGIDLRVYSDGQNAKYDWIVKPGGEVNAIRWKYEGSESLELRDGSIYASSKLADIIERKPYAYQIKNGHRFDIAVEFELKENLLSYSFPQGYDPCYELIIDPLLIFSTYSGATADNWGSSATPGENGTLYSTGAVRDIYTIGNNQTVTGILSNTAGSFQAKIGGGFDIAIFKYDSTGQKMIFASYLGGNETDSPHSLLLNSNKELLILGTTSSINFPTTPDAYSRTFAGGKNITATTVPYANGSDIIVSKISSDGTMLLSSTFLGGSDNDGLNTTGSLLTKNYGDDQRGDIITDNENNVYISSVTSSTDFPMANGFDATYNGGSTDAVLIKMNSSLTNLVWSTYIGGDQTDAAYSVKFDKNQDLLIAGGTVSHNFPVTVGSYQPNHAGDVDGWVARIASDGTSIKQATFTGTSSFDQVYFIDSDNFGDIYLYGQTSGNFPVTAGVYSNPRSGQFVQKISANLSSLIFSTVFGSGISIPNISPTAFLINDCNNLYMAGWGGAVNSGRNFWNSTTRDMPITSDALQKTTAGSDFYFMVLTADASELLYATYLGGGISPTHVDGGTSRFDKSGVVYHAVCAGCGGGNDDFLTTSKAWSRLNQSRNCNNAAFKFDLSSLTARLQTNNLERTLPGINKVCMPDPILFQNFSTGGESFEWDLGDGTIKVLNDTSSFSHVYTTPGVYTVRLTAIDQGTCKVRDVATKRMVVSTPLSEVQSDDVMCKGDSYQLKAMGAASYDWTSEDKSLTFSGQNPEVKPSKTTKYFVRITEYSGCIRLDTVKLKVIPIITPEFEIKRTAGCTIRPFVTVKNPNADSVNYSFTFDFGDGSRSDLPNTTHEYQTDNVFNVKLISQREFCVREVIKSVDVTSIVMPNVITPLSKEGKNDVFTIQYGNPGRTPADAGLSVSLLVLNRWGDVVYSNADYTYDWAGENLATGVYYYEASIEGYATCKDWLHIIK